MNISFTGLHVKRTPANIRNIQEIAADDKIRTTICESLKVINGKAADRDVFLKTEKNDAKNLSYPYYGISIVDKKGETLSKVNIVDYRAHGETHSDEIFSEEAAKGFKMLAAQMDDPNTFPMSANDIFNIFI